MSFRLGEFIPPPPPRQASEILYLMVPEHERPAFDKAVAIERRRLKREAWWYRHFPPYRWYINWGWK